MWEKAENWKVSGVPIWIFLGIYDDFSFIDYIFIFHER